MIVWTHFRFAGKIVAHCVLYSIECTQYTPQRRTVIWTRDEKQNKRTEEKGFRPSAYSDRSGGETEQKWNENQENNLCDGRNGCMCERKSVWMHRIDWTDDDGGGSTNDDDDDDDNNGASTLRRYNSPFAFCFRSNLVRRRKCRKHMQT